MKYIILLPLYVYKIGISPILVTLFGHGCRFQPTCSQYAIESIRSYGVLKGIRLSLQRLAKCHSWGGKNHGYQKYYEYAKPQKLANNPVIPVVPLIHMILS